MTANSEREIENCRALDKTMSNIVAICALNKNESKMQNMKQAFDAITVATRAYDKTLRKWDKEDSDQVHLSIKLYRKKGSVLFSQIRESTLCTRKSKVRWPDGDNPTLFMNDRFFK